MKLCRREELTEAQLERLIQLVSDKAVDINRRMRYDYAELGGAVTALEFTFNFQHIYRSYKLRRKDVKCLTQ